MKLLARYTLILVATLVAWNANAQSISDRLNLTKSPLETYRGLAFGGGVTVIDGVPFYLLHVAPQLQFGPFGIGIDGNIRISTDFKLRKQDWDETYDYLRWINYLSYGFPHDDIYARIGGLEHASIGSGVIVSDYSNFSSYDDRRIGFAGRFDLGFIGGEALTSDIFKRGFIALRPFTRPFQLVPGLGSVWFLSQIQFGVTGAFDFDTNATRIIPNHEPYVTHLRSVVDTSVDSVVIHSDSAHIPAPFTTVGADISTWLWQSEKTEGKLYADYVKFMHFNDGFVFGFRSSLFVADNVMLDLRGERSLFKNRFLPNYYNSFYERDRFDDQARPQDYITKLTLLDDSAGGNGNGFRFGELFNYHDEFELQTSYSHLDNLEGKDLIEMEMVFPSVLDKFYVRFNYARKNIDGVSDVFQLDERSLLTGLITMKPFNWLLLSAITRWTFAKDQFGHIQTQQVFEPKADFIFSL